MPRCSPVENSPAAPLSHPATHAGCGSPSPEAAFRRIAGQPLHTTAPRIRKCTHETPEALLLDTDCPASPGAPCCGRHGRPEKDAQGNIRGNTCPLLYRQIVARTKVGRGGTQVDKPELHALMCGHPDAPKCGVLGVLDHYSFPVPMRRDIPLKPHLSREVLDAVAIATGEAEPHA